MSLTDSAMFVLPVPASGPVSPVTRPTRLGLRDATPSARAISNWLVDRMARHLDVDRDEVDTQRPFADYGLGSMAAVKLSGDLERYLGREVSPTLTWDFPTIEQAAQHLADEAAANF